MKKIFFLLFWGCSFSSQAQFLKDVDGRPYLIKTTDGYEGSPLLFPIWVKATVTTAKGTVYKNMLVNVDLPQSLLLFMEGDSVYLFSENLKEFTLMDTLPVISFKVGKWIHHDLPDAFMEIISNSPLLLKKYDRPLIEIAGYANNIKTYRYMEGKAYYILLDNSPKKIDLTKENAQKVFAQKWKAIADFVQANKLSYTKEGSWKKMTEYYSATQ